MDVRGLILISALLPTVLGTAKMYLRLTRFSNPSGNDWHGKCCDPLCASRCDHALTVCLDDYHPSPYDHRNTDVNHCKFWRYETGRLNSGNTNNFPESYTGEFINPKESNMKRWPGKVVFKVNIKDHDRFDGDDRVDEMATTLDLTRARSSAEAKWTMHTIRGRRPNHPTSLVFYIRLFCDFAYYGEDCSVFCEPKDDVQFGHYTCDPDTGDKVCLPGYEEESTNCVIESDDCKGDPCMHGGTCVDGRQSYMCVCAPGYTGNKCQTEINHCESSPCMNDATCLTHLGKYVCSCQTGFVGTNCELHICDSQNACENGGTCVGNGQCYCPEGFSGNRCEVDMCSLLTCQQRGACVKGICLCPDGYIGKECELGPCHQITCLNGGTCSDGQCTCAPGYVGDICEGVENFCMSRPCKNTGSCYSNEYGYMCKCSPGYKGVNCTQKVELVPNYCVSGPCLNDGQCYTSELGFTCKCAAGYEGETCDVYKQPANATDFCDVGPCENGGSCESNKVGYTCNCLDGYEEPNCAFKTSDINGTDLCSSEPCQNSGDCYRNQVSFVCICPPGYSGKYCEMSNACYDQPCKNGGTCFSRKLKHVCQCAAGYTGDNCEDSPKDEDGTGRDPNLGAVTGREEQGFGFPIWVIGVISAVVVVIVVIVLAVVCTRRKKRSAQQPNDAEISRAGSFDNPTFQTENIYQNTDGITASASRPPSDIDVNIVPRDKVIYDAPQHRQTEAHGAQGPPTQPRRHSRGQDGPPPGALRTPKHLEQRYKAIQKAAALEYTK